MPLVKYWPKSKGQLPPLMFAIIKILQSNDRRCDVMVLCVLVGNIVVLYFAFTGFKQSRELPHFSNALIFGLCGHYRCSTIISFLNTDMWIYFNILWKCTMQTIYFGRQMPEKLNYKEIFIVIFTNYFMVWAMNVFYEFSPIWKY